MISSALANYSQLTWMEAQLISPANDFVMIFDPRSKSLFNYGYI